MQGKGKKLGKEERARRFTKWFWTILCIPVGIFLVLLVLTASGAFGRLPSFEELENPKSNLATEIYADDGRLLGSFFIQNRSYVDYEELSPALVAALVATEDARFYGHSGIDFISLARVAVKTLAFGNRSQGGAPSRSSSPKTSFRATPPFTAIRSCAADGWSSPSSRSG